MPNCFQLIDKETEEPAALVAVDVRMCHELGVDCHEINWYKNWKSVIGFPLSLGITLEKIKEETDDEELWNVVDWLEKTYTVESWYSPK